MDSEDDGYELKKKKEGEEWKATREEPRQNASCQGEVLPKREAEAENGGGPRVDDHSQGVPSSSYAAHTCVGRVGRWRR